MKHKILTVFFIIWLGAVIILSIIFVQQEPATIQQPAQVEPVQITYVAPTPIPTPTPTIKRYAGEFTTYGYDICVACCGSKTGITASGVKAVVGVTVAADWNVLPKGTVIEIEGVGRRIVQDTGGAIRGRKLDILCVNHSECFKMTGVRKVWVVE